MSRPRICFRGVCWVPATPKGETAVKIASTFSWHPGNTEGTEIPQLVGSADP